MNKIILLVITIYSFHFTLCFAEDSVLLNDLPPLPKETYLFRSEEQFGYRGKIGGFMLPPSRVGVYFDKTVYYETKEADHQSMKVMYKKVDKKSFCGAYVIFLADISNYKTMTFLIKGQRGGETFEVGINDVISNKREDAVYVGAINRYLPGGVTKGWQLVKVPLSDFFGPDLSKVYSLVFHFNDIGEGVFWIDEIRFCKEDLISQERIAE
ncbi:MAG: hypothetical protein NC828_05140, partial [Candidatus Omnitrophica bacterium]|nr:hypothetical protein [Candidatus Omnitrophota bacterium]